MALKGTVFGFYGTKSLRKNYYMDKKCIINIGFKVFSKTEKWKKIQKWQNLIFCPKIVWDFDFYTKYVQLARKNEYFYGFERYYFWVLWDKIS